MAQNEVNQYNEADETNVDITGTPVAPAQMYPYHVDDAFRKLMGALKRSYRSTLFRIRDGADQTKLLAFDLSAISPSATRTLAVPNGSGTLSLSEQPFIDIASAATTDIGGVASTNVRITGTTTITSFGVAPAGTTRNLLFASTLQLTYNATSMILPNGTLNITTSVNDAARAVSLGGGNWRVTEFDRPVYSPGAAPFFACRAWLNYNGNAQSIRGAGNIASVTRNGPGDYTVTFSVAMPDDTYVINVSTGNDSNLNAGVRSANVLSAQTAATSTFFRIGTYTLTGTTRTPEDSPFIYVSVHR